MSPLHFIDPSWLARRLALVGLITLGGVVVTELAWHDVQALAAAALGLVRSSWQLLLAAGVLGILLAAVVVVPRRVAPIPPVPTLARWEEQLTHKERLELAEARLKLRNDLRTTVLQAIAGLAVLAGALVAWQQLAEDRYQANATQELTRQGQASERFTRAKLGAANKSRQDLRGVDLSGADLRGAHLYDADLGSVALDKGRLSGANLGGADLRGAEFLEKARLAGALADSSTRWPDGFDWRAAGVQLS